MSSPVGLGAVPFSTGSLLAIYIALVLLASLLGGLLPLFVRLTHTRLQVAISFVAGLMLGVGVLHMLPHAWQELRSIDLAAAWLLAGFVVMFFIQRFFHFHHHDVPNEDDDSAKGTPPSGESLHRHVLVEHAAHRLSWSTAALGLTLHSLIDGVALAASIQAEAGAPGTAGLRGLGTFLVIVLHKPFDAVAIGTLMAAGGHSKPFRHLVNVLFALAIPAGVAFFYCGASTFAGMGDYPVGVALAFTAGSFICIAASDLLPELQFHAHDRLKLSLALLFGLGMAALLGLFETSGHERHHPTEAPSVHGSALSSSSEKSHLVIKKEPRHRRGSLSIFRF